MSLVRAHFFLGRARRGVDLILLLVLGMAFYLSAQASPLMEEGLNYAAGSALAADAPWHGGSAAALSVVSGNLSLLTLREMAPPGNMLRIGGGTAVRAYRNFNAAPVVSVAGTAVYCSALITCTVLPTNVQNLASLLVSGATSFNGNDDPLALYALNAGDGCAFRIAHHGENATAGKVLTANTTHLIVCKYLFGGRDRCALFIDPTPGQPEPSPDAITPSGEGDPVSNLQVIGLKSPALASQGAWTLDTLRVGTNWADVTPPPNVLTVSGPQNQAACAGTPATFTVSVSGTPPFGYLWRADGVSISNATNSSYTLANPGPAEALKAYDVIVSDAFNSTTSSVAGLSVSVIAPHILTPPADQVLAAGSDATFTVLVAGDAPLSFQWRINGTPIPDATNDTYILISPTTAAALNAFDVVVANPCGSTTSSPPAYIVFPHEFFGCDALPGFFGGMNLLTTNLGGISLFVWSSADPGLPVPNWTLEGQLGEQPLNDGTGNSRYSINVNPLTSPVYYLIGTTTAGPYLPDVPVSWITTDEFGGYGFFATNLLINTAGVLGFPSPPAITQSPVTQAVLSGQAVKFAVIASGSGDLGYQWFFKNNILPVATNAALILSGVTNSQAGDYFAVVTNNYGAATSAVAVLTIVPPPQLAVKKVLTGIQFSGTAVPGEVYRVLVATNLQPPVVWTMRESGIVASNGLVQFMDANPAAYPECFYRLAFSSTLPAPPAITQQPSSRSVLPGQIGSFNAAVTGSEPLSYQWYFNTNTALAGGTEPTLTFTGGTTGSAGSYFLLVTNYSGSATSSIVNLTLLPPLQLAVQLVAGGLQLSSVGVPGDTYVLQGSTSLIPPIWINLATNVAALNGLIQFSDPNPAGHPGYFYRLISP